MATAIRERLRMKREATRKSERQAPLRWCQWRSPRLLVVCEACENLKSLSRDSDMDVLDSSWSANDTTDEIPEEFAIENSPPSSPNAIWWKRDQKSGRERKKRELVDLQTHAEIETKRAQSCQTRLPMIVRGDELEIWIRESQGTYWGMMWTEIGRLCQIYVEVFDREFDKERLALLRRWKNKRGRAQLDQELAVKRGRTREKNDEGELLWLRRNEVARRVVE